MILKSTLKKVVESQKIDLDKRDKGVTRELLAQVNLNLPHATVISGVRRCGKSTLLKQLMGKLNCYYFNFEDPKTLNFEVSDF